MAELIANISIITWNVNSLNTPIERRDLQSGFKNMKVKGLKNPLWLKIYANINKKKAGVLN